MSAAQYRVFSPAGVSLEDGQADAEVTAGTLVLAPAAGGTHHIPFGQISSITEPEPFTVRITLADGTAIDLSRLGVMRTQLLAELRDGRADDIASAAGAVGAAEIFSAVTAGVPVEVRVYDDALLVIGDAGSERISLSFAQGAEVRDYAVTVEVAERAPLVLSRLGRRTGELADVLTSRLREARGRTAAFLESLLPGLGPMARREAAWQLRDGVAVPVSTLAGIHPELASTLLAIATLPGRQDAVAELARRTDLAIGFKQLVSVRQPAMGVTPWQDHAAAPHIGEHQSPGGSFQPGLAGMLAASVMSGGPIGPGSGPGPGPGAMFGFGDGYGQYGGYWAFRALGAGMNSREQRPMAARPDLARGCLTPATEDLAALTAAGQNPTVLAFALGCRAGRVVYEALNQPGPTVVYDADEPGGRAAVNRALDDAGFGVAAVHGQGLAVPAARPNALAQALAGQVPHDGQWAERIGELLAT
jgi:hypothetical protein